MHITIGLSGGVDSSVAAWFLKKQGHKVDAIFMKNWDDETSGACNAKEDFLSAAVAMAVDEEEAVRMEGAARLALAEAETVRRKEWAAAAQERMARMSVEAGNRGWVAVFAPLAFYALLGFAGYAGGLAGLGYAVQAAVQMVGGGSRGGSS